MSILRKVATAEGTAAQMTFTFSHNLGDPVAGLWDALSYALGKVTSGKQWVAEQEQFRIIGWTKSVEVKRSTRFGWHIHAHLYPVFDQLRSDVMLEALGDRWFVRWQRACARKGLRTSHDAFFVQRMDLGDVDGAAAYMTKPTSEKTRSAAHEVTSAVHKIGRPVTADDVEDDGNEHLDRFEILDRAAAGDEEALGWWREFEEASLNRESFRISAGLKAWAATAPDDTPAEVLEPERAQREAQRPQPVVQVTADGWKLVLRHDVADVLRAMQRATSIDGAREAAIQWLDARGIRWHEPDPPAWQPFPFEDDPFLTDWGDPPW